MRKPIALIAAALALSLASCATGPSIRTDFDPTVNFSEKRTYSWVFTNPPRGMNPLLFERIKASVDRSLAERGFTRAEPGDFAVAFTLGRRDRVEVNDWGSYGRFYTGWGWGPRPWGWGPSYRQIEVREVTEGSLAIDIFDTATKQPIWHGVASQQINPSRIPDQAKIDRAIADIIVRFPPQN